MSIAQPESSERRFDEIPKPTFFPEREDLTADQISDLRRNLPAPILTRVFPSSIIEVHSAKGLHDSKWSHENIQRLVAEARKSYRAYGEDIPLFDSYDPKSAIYLARVVSSDERGVGEEWFSLRFVPGLGSPVSNEDINFYVYSEEDNKAPKPIIQALTSRLFELEGLSDEEALAIIATQSRFCKIGYQILRSVEGSSSQPPRRKGKSNKNAALSFALMNRQFYEDTRLLDTPPSVLTCQMHEDLSDEILSFKRNDETVTMPFTPAHVLLDLERSQVRLDRQNQQVYAYQVPGYFLKLDSLAKVLRSLVDGGELSYDTLSEYVSGASNSDQLQDMFNNPKIKHFKRLGELLGIKGNIPRSNITGEQLKVQLNRGVEDGPIWRVMLFEPWIAGVDRMVNSAY